MVAQLSIAWSKRIKIKMPIDVRISAGRPVLPSDDVADEQDSIGSLPFASQGPSAHGAIKLKRLQEIIAESFQRVSSMIHPGGPFRIDLWGESFDTNEAAQPNGLAPVIMRQLEALYRFTIDRNGTAGVALTQDEDAVMRVALAQAPDLPLGLLKTCLDQTLINMAHVIRNDRVSECVFMLGDAADVCLREWSSVLKSEAACDGDEATMHRP
jgi:hypothetical protein